MSASQVSKTGNRLLDQLPENLCCSITGVCEQVDLTSGQVLYEKDSLLTHVYFPITVIISKVAEINLHPPLGMVQIGSEGILGATLILGVKSAPLRAIVQSEGTALRMEVSKFHECLRDNPLLRLVLGRYLYVLLEELSQTAACTHFHKVEARLVRWLLLTHDRSKSDNFHLTHQVLADMLGVQRSAITIAAGVLQQKNLISYTRGDITIINRAGLEAMCCECYELVVEDYQRLIA